MGDAGLRLEAFEFYHVFVLLAVQLLGELDVLVEHWSALFAVSDVGVHLNLVEEETTWHETQPEMLYEQTNVLKRTENV